MTITLVRLFFWLFGVKDYIIIVVLLNFFYIYTYLNMVLSTTHTALLCTKHLCWGMWQPFFRLLTPPFFVCAQLSSLLLLNLYIIEFCSKSKAQKKPYIRYLWFYKLYVISEVYVSFINIIKTSLFTQHKRYMRW